MGKRRRQPIDTHLIIPKLERLYGRQCMKCGAADNLQLDHILPWSKGGTNRFDNFQLLCRPCNFEKGDAIADYRPRPA